MKVRQRAGRGLIGRIQFTFRNRPVLAVAVSVVSLLVVATAITFTTPLRCRPAKALGLKNIASGCITVAAVGTPGPVAINPSPTPFSGKGNPYPYPPNGNPASGPYGNPASGPYPPYGNPASGAYPPSGNQASPAGPYPPFYAPASNGAVGTPPPLDCRLPVYAGPPGSGGFIVFPGGNFIPDQSSSVTVPATSPTPPPVGGPGPGYYGQPYGLTYDRPFSKWVPVQASQVAPDGSRYAYTAADGIYVVSVANNTQSELGEGHSWTIVAVQTDGVYAGDPQAGGLWVLPFSGTPRQITKTGYWRVASKTAAYGTATSAVPQGASNTIQRLDLATGSAIDWFTRPGTQSNVTGLDGKGNPIINVTYLNNTGTEIWIATGATSASAIAAFAQYGGGFNSWTTPVTDSHGIWFAGNWSSGYGGGNLSGMALYVAGTGFHWMSGYGAQLAGGCY
jgi:hypothetical protein